jgi:arylsulfatase B
MYFFALLLFASPAPLQSQTVQPNLLVIVTDDMGYGDLSCYGSLQIPTPNIDALAERGVRFTEAYVSSSVCSPSRAGIMTGRNGSRFGYEHNLHLAKNVTPEYIGIPLNEKLLPQYLGELGYRTGLVGKWHLGESVEGHHPNNRGFDYFFGILSGSHPYWPKVGKHRIERNGLAVSEIGSPYLTDWFTDEAIQFASKKDADGKPWFLFLSYNTPHSPLQAKDVDLEKFSHINNAQRRKYCAMQSCMDENVGRIVDYLEDSNELDNTVIVFLSDNGGSVEVSHAVNAPLRGGKGTFLEGGLRVPMILSWPKEISPQVYTEPVVATDILGTLVGAAGGDAPQSKETKIFDTVNLIPYLKEELGERLPHEILFWRMSLRASAVREGDWKLLRPNSEFPQLYFLKDDPSELNNLIFKNADMAESLLKKLNQWEHSLEKNPAIISTPNWSKYNARLYDREYLLKQPLPDDVGNHWKLKKSDQ